MREESKREECERKEATYDGIKYREQEKWDLSPGLPWVSVTRMELYGGCEVARSLHEACHGARRGEHRNHDIRCVLQNISWNLIRERENS